MEPRTTEAKPTLTIDWEPAGGPVRAWIVEHPEINDCSSPVEAFCAVESKAVQQLGTGYYFKFRDPNRLPPEVRNNLRSPEQLMNMVLPPRRR